MKSPEDTVPAPSYKHTLNLPRTDFPIRPNAAIDDPRMIERWEKEGLYTKALTKNEGSPRFVLHDGPPYANGNIHIGHAYNKILKDIITKAQRMFGLQVPVIPGWDCHGLPIEHKVSQEQPNLSRYDMQKACRAYAQRWVDIQREEFKRLGVIMDWAHPYLTMDFSYEALVLRAFGQLVAQEFIERKNKTVPWCATCGTVLALAEIEYAERKDPSIFVRFPLTAASTKNLFGDLKQPVSLLVWTTTPWTLPLNRAVCIKPDTPYAVVECDNTYLLVARDCVPALRTQLERPLPIVAEINSAHPAFQTARAQHPLIDTRQVPIIVDQSVVANEGTGLMHCAPGAGPIDYDIGVRNNLEIYSPVGPDGVYTADIEPAQLAGLSITQGQSWVMTTLNERQMMVHKTSIRHSYPHCWRCRNGLIFRATKQWFLDLTKHNLRQDTVGVVDDIFMLPVKSHNRLKAALESRLEWCISRQRAWGIPIPAVVCTSCDEAYTSVDLINRVADNVHKLGIESWGSLAIEDFLPHDATCRNCAGKSFKKEQDILDVWLESGLSHYAILAQNPLLSLPADMYLEGKDQHRAWFQSSLLTSMALHKKPCMKSIITHGFVVDEKGQKMSKSLGNVVSPTTMIEKLGTDGFRLWASSIDFSGEVVVSQILIQNVQEVYRKIRNTARFLLSNLYDFSYPRDAVAYNELQLIDQQTLADLLATNYEILQAYASYNITGVFHRLGDYAAGLSSFYLDIIKDRLYVEGADSCERRSAQTVCYQILDTLTRLVAPVLSCTAEQLADLYQADKNTSIHLQQFSRLADVWAFFNTQNAAMPAYDAQRALTDAAVTTMISSIREDASAHMLKEIRTVLLKAIEQQREKGIIKHSLEAQCMLFIDPSAALYTQWKTWTHQIEKREAVQNFFKEFVIVSDFKITTQKNDHFEQTQLSGVWVAVAHAPGQKCPRCWQWHEHDDVRHLCGRCAHIVDRLSPTD